MCSKAEREKNKKKSPENVVFSGLLASPARFERAAFRLGGDRSILLSYGGRYENYASYRRKGVPLIFDANAPVGAKLGAIPL